MRHRFIGGRGGGPLPGDERTQFVRIEVLVAFAFGATIACFLGAAAEIAVGVSQVAAPSIAISDDALPRVLSLVRLRSRLHELRRALAGGAGENTPDLPALALAFEALDTEWRGCEAFGKTNGDATLWSRVREALAVARSRHVAYVRAARLASIDVLSLDEGIARADAALEEIVSIQCRAIHDEALRAGDVRGASLRRAYAGYMGSVIVALALAALTVRSLRHRHRSIGDRIDELEAFAARVAHDVRGPLAPAIAALQRAAARLPAEDPVRASVARGERSLRTLERVVHALLAFALSGARPDRRASTSVGTALEAVIAEHFDEAAAADVQLSLRCEGRLSAACSHGVLASIAGNLVGNAIKFVVDSAERRVELRARREGQRTRIEVEDTGPGVPRGLEARIFEPYVKGPDGRTGLGLGLATVKRLTVAHGGSVGLQRGERCGTVFWVELPLAGKERGV
jgi:signal transduction histidine kinase